MKAEGRGSEGGPEKDTGVNGEGDEPPALESGGASRSRRWRSWRVSRDVSQQPMRAGTKAKRAMWPRTRMKGESARGAVRSGAVHGGGDRGADEDSGEEPGDEERREERGGAARRG